MPGRSCLVCKSSMHDCYLPGLLRCEACSFVTADLDLTPGVVEGLYGEEYFHGLEYADYVADRVVIEENARKRLAILLRFVSAPSQKTLWEIGCAYGFFLHVAKPHFGAVHGIDISRPAVAHARSLGIDATAGEFLEHPVSEIDVSCMWDTIEHLPRPDLYIAKLSNAMRPGSAIAITTGDISSRVARIRGRRWRQIHPPTHLHYFSRSTLSLLLQAHGFEVVFSGSDSIARSIDMIAYIILVQRHSWERTYNTMKKLGLLKGRLTLDFGDLMFLIARKT